MFYVGLNGPFISSYPLCSLASFMLCENINTCVVHIVCVLENFEVKQSNTSLLLQLIICMIKHSNYARLLKWYCDNHYHGSNLRMHGNTVCDMFWYWFYHFKWTKPILMNFRRWLGEVFTSDDVLLPNFVLFLWCTSLETWHIQLLITKKWYDFHQPRH